MYWFFRDDEYLVNMQHTVIPSWYQREGYINAMANLIEKELKGFDCPEKVQHYLCLSDLDKSVGLGHFYLVIIILL